MPMSNVFLDVHIFPDPIRCYGMGDTTKIKQSNAYKAFIVLLSENTWRGIKITFTPMWEIIISNRLQVSSTRLSLLLKKKFDKVALRLEMESDGTVTIHSELHELFHPSLYAIDSFFTCAPCLHIPLRTTFVKLPNDKLLVYSPTNPDLLEIQKVRQLGDLVAIVVPNSVHMTYAQRMHDVFPAATIFSSPAVSEKDSNGDWGVIIRDSLKVNDDIVLFCVSDMTPFREVVALHIPSRTLLIADLASNITPQTLQHAGIGANLFCRAVRGFGRLDNGLHVKFMMWKFCSKSRWQYEELSFMPWENVVPCHGDVVQKEAKVAFRDGIYKFICSPSKELAFRLMPYVVAFSLLWSAILILSGSRLL